MKGVNYQWPDRLHADLKEQAGWAGVSFKDALFGSVEAMIWPKEVWDRAAGLRGVHGHSLGEQVRLAVAHWISVNGG